MGVDATPADLQHMRSQNSLHSYKSIRLDDGITGSDPTRPGFKALIHDSISDRSISHNFGFRRDRFFRPEEPVEALQTEKDLSRAGVTIVFSTEVVPPRRRGKNETWQRISACCWNTMRPAHSANNWRSE